MYRTSPKYGTRVVNDHIKRKHPDLYELYLERREMSVKLTQNEVLKLTCARPDPRATGA
ncbi:UNVERIFIED_CONTAM: hypothetical protein PYX00_001509 [Menopon gallinae]|uniref:Uncharacterized protein n=1 Tax=Menopon gallinae TaxID=328185 RepID=A0AAW2ID18_9NEOP